MQGFGIRPASIRVCCGESTAQEGANMQNVANTSLPGADAAHPAGRYRLPARLLHWATAVLMLVVWPVGQAIDWVYEVEWAKTLGYAVHENLAVIIWVLVLLRLAWRWLVPPPPLPASMMGVQKLAAHAVHAGLYMFLFLMPIVGFVATNAWGFPLELFGVVMLPDPIGNNEEAAKVLSFIHEFGAYALLGLIAVHIGAALFHQYVLKDGTLQRML
jgi:cytochrome b561